MRQGYEPVIIFSAYQDDLSNGRNLKNHEQLLDDLHWQGIPHKVLVGCWKGRKELSVMVPEYEEGFVNRYGNIYKQEAYRTLDNERGAHITDFKTRKKNFVGFFIGVPKAVALKEDGWTLAADHIFGTNVDGDESTHRYYIISTTRLQGHLVR